MITKRGGEDKKDFIERMSKYSSRLQGFAVSKAVKSAVDVDQWFLYGNVTVLKPAGRKCYQGRVVANLDGGKWRFSPILESLIVPVDGNPLDCKTATKKAGS